jgi:hypothetical protein
MIVIGARPRSPTLPQVLYQPPELRHGDFRRFARGCGCRGEVEWRCPGLGNVSLSDAVDVVEAEEGKLDVVVRSRGCGRGHGGERSIVVQGWMRVGEVKGMVRSGQVGVEVRESSRICIVCARRDGAVC